MQTLKKELINYNMREFHITSEKFTGHVKMVFNTNDELITICFAEAALRVKQKQLLLQKMPMAVFAIENFVSELPLTIVETEYQITFDMFWATYDKKINRKRCEPLWNKLSKTKQIAALTGIKHYEKYLQVASWRKKADPENYLRNEMWENEWK